MTVGREHPFTLSVEQAAAPMLAAEGFELVLAEFVPASGVLRLYIDIDIGHPDRGVSLDDCSRVSRLVGDLLDAEGVSDMVSGSYTLEVSSPGLDRPLVRPRDFQRFVGSQVKVTTGVSFQGGRRHFKGELAAADDDGIRVVVDGESCAFAYDAIERARLVPVF